MGTSSTYNKDLLNQKSQKFYNDLSKLNTVQTMNIDDKDDLSEKRNPPHSAGDYLISIRFTRW